MTRSEKNIEQSSSDTININKNNNLNIISETNTIDNKKNNKNRFGKNINIINSIDNLNKTINISEFNTIEKSNIINNEFRNKTININKIKTSKKDFINSINIRRAKIIDINNISTKNKDKIEKYSKTFKIKSEFKINKDIKGDFEVIIPNVQKVKFNKMIENNCYYKNALNLYIIFEKNTLEKLPDIFHLFIEVF